MKNLSLINQVKRLICNGIAASMLIIVAAHFHLFAAPIADGCDKFLGNISTSGPPSNFLNYWNQVTLENNGKWANVESSRDQMNWGPIQAAYDYCQKNKIPYKHHTFLWNEQYPSWMDGLSAADQKAEVEELIKSFGQKFPETAFIDVANETREKSPKWKNALGGEGTSGYDWLVWGFKTARKYCPKAKLLINEYYCEYSLEFVTEYLKKIKVLKDSGVIDGIGIQTHDGETKKGYQTGMLKKCIDSLATAGLPIYSTELDLSGNDAEQLKFYQDIFPVIWEHPAIHGVTLWGWTDSWLLHVSKPADARLIINNQERPALKWLRTYVPEHKKTIPTTPVLRIAEPRESSLTLNYADGVLRMHTSEAQTLLVRVFDPAGRTVFSIPQRPYGQGCHAISLPGAETGTGCYLFSVEGKSACIIGKAVLGR
jgi:endo-1,4-beta-xylanase